MRVTSRRGTYVVLEGIDGVGKTTQVRALASLLPKEEIRLVTEPSDTPVGRLTQSAWSGELRMSPEAQSLLFAADSTELTRTGLQSVESMLRRGLIVLGDRCFLSTIAYLSDACSENWLWEIHARCLMPDLILILDLPPRHALHRIRLRGEKHAQSTKVEYLVRVRRRYKLAAMEMRRRGFAVEVLPIRRESLPAAVTEALLLRLQAHGICLNRSRGRLQQPHP